MGRTHHAEEFKREAVLPVEVSGWSVPEITADWDVGRAPLSSRIKDFRDQNILGGPHEDASEELFRLRKENGILRQKSFFKSDRVLHQRNESKRYQLLDAPNPHYSAASTSAFIGAIAAAIVVGERSPRTSSLIVDMILLAHINNEA